MLRLQLLSKNFERECPMVSFIKKCLCWVVWRTNPNNSRTFLGMCCLVGCYLVTIGLALESGLPLTWSKNMLRLQLLSKNFERECPMVSFIKKCLRWVVWRTNPNNSRTFLGMCCLVGCYLVTIGLALESGLPLTWSKNMLRLQLLSKNFERECPMVSFITKCLCWVVWRTNPNNSRTFLGMCCLVGCYLVTIGLALESGLPLTWSKNMLRLQLLSKNFERECPMVSFIKKCLCWVVWRTNPNNSRTFLGMCCLVGCYLVTIGLALESGLPLTWSKNMLRLQLLSKNFERECPMVSFIKKCLCWVVWRTNPNNSRTFLGMCCLVGCYLVTIGLALESGLPLTWSKNMLRLQLLSKNF